MTEFLCIGGPLHGQVLDVPEPQNGLTIKPSAAEELLRPADAPPMRPIRYVLRGVNLPAGDDGKRFVRPVMAMVELQPQQLMMGIADVLVTAWVREGEEVDEEAGTDNGSGGMPGSGGRGGDATPGTGLIAP